jgi:hypothetical protein
MSGMVGFVKELIDACCFSRVLDAHWGGGPRRRSKIERLHVVPNLAVVIKASEAQTP